MTDNKVLAAGGCCGSICCTGFIIIITVLASIKTLGPEDQIVVHYLDGKAVERGPKTKVYNPFRDKEVRKATRLGPTHYCLIRDTLNGARRIERGPKLVFLEAYEELQGEITPTVVLKKDQYIRYIDRLTGVERVVKGPQTIVPGPWEVSEDGVQQAAFIDTDKAVLVLNKESGMLRLITQRGVFFPDAYEMISETRNLYRVLPHECVVMRSAYGLYNVYCGADGNGTGTSFFLPPYSAMVTMEWSAFGEPTVGVDTQTISKVAVQRISMHIQKTFFQYEVRTNDNVNLRVQGTIWWRVVDVRKLINVTGDPVGDVWHRARSSLIQAVSRAPLAEFRSNFNQIVNQAFLLQKNASADNFYDARGLEIYSMEMIDYECVDEETARTLELVVQETTNRINRLQAQQSENDVRSAKLEAEILLEKQRTNLIETQAKNDQLQAEKEGEAEGTKLAKGATTFINGLNNSLPSLDQRVELYKLHNSVKNQNEKTHDLSMGKATLFLSPDELDLKVGTEL